MFNNTNLAKFIYSFIYTDIQVNYNFKLNYLLLSWAIRNLWCNECIKYIFTHTKPLKLTHTHEFAAITLQSDHLQDKIDERAQHSQNVQVRRQRRTEEPTVARQLKYKKFKCTIILKSKWKSSQSMFIRSSSHRQAGQLINDASKGIHLFVEERMQVWRTLIHIFIIMILIKFIWQKKTSSATINLRGA